MKRFYRSKNSKYLSGVCGGLGYHTKVDPILWRVFFVMLGIGGLIPYILLTIFTKYK